VLSRTNLAELSHLISCASSISFTSFRLRALFLSCLSFFDRRPLFSIACSLFSKDTGGGVIPGIPATPPHPLRRAPSRFYRFSNPAFSSTYKSLLSQLLCFHIHLRCRGVAGYHFAIFHRAKGSTVTRTEEKMKIHAIMKLADGPGDRWLRAIGAGGKSGHRRRRPARAGDE
jgi:hypothetical protein